MTSQEISPATWERLGKQVEIGGTSRGARGFQLRTATRRRRHGNCRCDANSCRGECSELQALRHTEPFVNHTVLEDWQIMANPFSENGYSYYIVTI